MNFAKLRFREFTEYPKAILLRNACTFFSGGTPLTSNKTFYGGNIPFIKSGEIHKSFTNQYLTEEGLTYSSAKLIKKGDLLIALYGATSGEIAMSKQDGAINQAVLCVRSSKIDTSFLFYNFQKHKKNIIEKYLQGGQGNLSADIIKSLSFFFPCEKEQNKIADFLLKVDTRITFLKEKKTLLEQYKKAVMQKIFSQELRFKDENGDEFSSWQETTLGEIGTFQTSSIDKLTRDNEKKIFLVNYMNVYRHENINRDTIQSFQIVTAKDSQISSCSLKKGDILFTPSSETPSDIGHSVVIFEDLTNAVFSYHLMRFRPSIEINTLFSHYFCNTTEILNQLSKLATGSTRFTISVKSFSSIKVKLPSLGEQKQISSFLKILDEKIFSIENQIKECEKWKKGLLQKMFV